MTVNHRTGRVLDGGTVRIEEKTTTHVHDELPRLSTDIWSISGLIEDGVRFIMGFYYYAIPIAIVGVSIDCLGKGGLRSTYC